MATENNADARRAYNEAKKRAETEVKRAEETNQNPYVAALDDILQTEKQKTDEPAIYHEETVGKLEIPPHRIIGTKTVGRRDAFSAGFMPLLEPSSEFAAKWQNLYAAQIDEGFRDPIKVFEYRGFFFVQEGNKRVSVARFLNMALIEATITRILPPKTDDPAIRQYYEFRDFFRLFPTYDIDITQAGGYEKFCAFYEKTVADEEPFPEDLQKHIRASFLRFRDAFYQSGGGNLNIGAGDAYLVYLETYGTHESAARIPAKLLSERVKKLMNEYEVQSGGGKIRALETPPDAAEEEVTTRPDEIRILRTGLFRTPKYTEEKPLRAAFFYHSDAASSRWARDHELGRQLINEHFGGIVKTETYAYLDTDEKLRHAIDAAVENGNELFFTTTPPMFKETVRSAIHYKDRHFLNCSLGASSSAVRTYFGKMYEAKFILGALAASLSESHRIGYIADRSNYNVFPELNAFAIGASLTDPLAKILLVWSDEKNEVATEKLNGVDLLSGSLHKNMSEPNLEYGLYDIRDLSNIRSLAMPVWNFGEYYERIFRSVFAGTYENIKSDDEAIRYYFGLSSNVLDIVCSEKLTYSSLKFVDGLKSAIAAGQIHPFGGEIRSTTGVIQKTGRLTENDIIQMDWLNDNIIGEIPEDAK